MSIGMVYIPFGGTQYFNGHELQRARHPRCLTSLVLSVCVHLGRKVHVNKHAREAVSLSWISDNDIVFLRCRDARVFHQRIGIGVLSWHREALVKVQARP